VNRQVQFTYDNTTGDVNLIIPHFWNFAGISLPPSLFYSILFSLFFLFSFYPFLFSSLLSSFLFSSLSLCLFFCYLFLFSLLIPLFAFHTSLSSFLFSFLISLALIFSFFSFLSFAFVFSCFLHDILEIDPNYAVLVGSNVNPGGSDENNASIKNSIRISPFLSLFIDLLLFCYKYNYFCYLLLFFLC
jgi:hypothetical protein